MDLKDLDDLPPRIDEGSDPLTITREWIEQIVDSNVEPRIEGLRIRAISLNSDHALYVISTPQATTYTPHQAPDHKYYCRQNFQSVPIEYYQIRDARRRETTPKPFIDFTFADERKDGSFSEFGANGQSIFRLHARLRNRSRQPAVYAIATIFISTTVTLISQSSFQETEYYGDQFGNNYVALRKRFGIPNDFPIFQEAGIPMCSPPLSIGVDGYVIHDGSIPIGYEILTPVTAQPSLVSFGANTAGCPSIFQPTFPDRRTSIPSPR